MMHDQAAQNLIRMADQIASFFLSQAEGVAAHADKFSELRIPEQGFRCRYK